MLLRIDIPIMWSEDGVSLISFDGKDRGRSNIDLKINIKL
jgi:hypothetical protein